MSFHGSHRSSASLSANQPPSVGAPSPFANKLRLNSPAGSLLPPIPPPAPLGLPDLETISLGSMSSKPTPIPQRRSTSPLRPQAFDRSMDPEVEDDEEVPWGDRTLPPRPRAESPAPGSPVVARFASTFATRVNSLFAPEAPAGNGSRHRMTDAELEAEAERAREQSRREAERILTEEAAERRRAEERALALKAQQRAQAEQQQRALERAQLGRPVTPTRGMSLSPATSPKKEKEGENSWWGMAKSKLTPTREKEKDLTPAQLIAAEARNKEREQEKDKDKEKEKGKETQKDKGKKSGEWPAQPGVRSTDPTLLAMAAASQMSTSPGGGGIANHFLSGGLSTSPSGYPSYSPKPIMPHEQLAREIEAQGGGRVSSDLFGTRHSTDGLLGSSPKTPLPFASRATPSPAPSPLQPARAQTNPAQMGLSNTGTSLVGRSPNTSPDKSPNADKDKRLNTLDSDKRTNTSGTVDEGAPPLYAQFTPTGALDVPLTLLTVARRFEKLEKWTVGHVRALEERMKDVERYLVEKDSKADVAGKEIGLLKAGIQDIRRSMESLRDAIPPPTMLQPAMLQPTMVPVTPARNVRLTEVAQDPDTVTARSRAMSANSASSYATAISVLSGDTSNPNAVRASVISLGSVEADGIEVRPSVAEVVTPLANRQPLPSIPSVTNSLSNSISTSRSSMGSPPPSTSTSRSFASPPGSGSREFKPVPSSAKEFSPPPPLSRVSSLTATRPQSPPTGLRSRLPYPTGDYTSMGQPVTPLAAAAAAFPMPPGASNSSLTLAAGSSTAPLSIRSVDRERDKEKEKEKEPSERSTPLALPPSRAPRAESTSPTPRKRYTIALSGGDAESLPTQTAVFTTSPLLSPDLGQPRTSPTTNRTRSQSTYGFQPPSSPSPSPSPAAGRLRRAVSSSNDGSGGLAAVFAQTEDWEDVREKVLTPRLANGSGEAKFVDPLVIRRKGAGGATSTNGNGAKPTAGAGRGKVPISQLVKFFDGDK